LLAGQVLEIILRVGSLPVRWTENKTPDRSTPAVRVKMPESQRSVASRRTAKATARNNTRASSVPILTLGRSMTA
jgi:hypothetical protein